MAAKLKEKIVELVEQPLAAEGSELADVVVSRYRGNVTLRLFVHSPGGTTIEKCARLSKIVGRVLDNAALFESGYVLEVSSLGLDRPLRTARDFRYRIGETVKIQFVDPKTEKLRAKILSVADDRVELETETGVMTLDLQQIEQAKIVF